MSDIKNITFFLNPISNLLHFCLYMFEIEKSFNFCNMTLIAHTSRGPEDYLKDIKYPLAILWMSFGSLLDICRKLELRKKIHIYFRLNIIQKK